MYRRVARRQQATRRGHRRRLDPNLGRRSRTNDPDPETGPRLVTSGGEPGGSRGARTAASWPRASATARFMSGRRRPDGNSVSFRGHTIPDLVRGFQLRRHAPGAWGRNGTIKIWDADTGRLTAEIAHPGGVTAGAWSPDDKLLASGHDDGTVTISGTPAGDKVVTLRGHADTVYHLAWSPDSTRLASTGGDFHREDLGRRLGKNGGRPAPAFPRGHVGRVGAEWKETGDRQHRRDGQDLGHDHGPRGSHAAWTSCRRCTSSRLGPDGRLASGCGDGSVRIWTSIRDQESSVLPGHAVRATSVAWSPDGKRLASGGDDGKIRIWDPATRKEVVEPQGT